MSLLPPCLDNLNLHLQRANYVAYLIRHSYQLRPAREEFIRHGWNDEGRPLWFEKYVPEEIGEVLIKNEESYVDDDDHNNLSDDEDLWCEIDDVDLTCEDVE